MSLISTLTTEDLKLLQDEIAEKARPCPNLETAAQTYVSILYDRLSDSIVLARFFATIPFQQLPPTNRTAVQSLADTAGIMDQLKESTLILTLLGTRGVKPDWNDRRLSKGHIGIPLVSAAFIDAIPMISQLLNQLGFRLDWIDCNDSQLVMRTAGILSGVFYVRDAKTEVNNKGQKIIAAQDFVESQAIKTVFGIGGAFLGSSMFFTTIVFLRETVEKDIVDRFMLHANKFKTATMAVVNAGKIFS